LPLCIWYISKYVVPPTQAGVGSRGFHILREIARMGHQCLLVTSDSNHLAKIPALEEPYRLETVQGVDVCWLRTRKYVGAKSLGRALSWLDFEWKLLRHRKRSLPKPDVIIASSLSPLTILNGIWLKHKFKCRLVFEVRDIWPLTIVEEGNFSRFNPFVIALGLIERIGYCRADQIVGTMPNLEAHVREITGQNRPVYCIPMGIYESELENVLPLPHDYAPKHIPIGKFLVCHAGTIGITNALDTFFECALLMQEHKDIHFLMVGKGDLKTHYQELYEDLPNVSFAPAVPKAMVQSVLEKCDLLFFSAFKSKVWDFGQSLNKVTDYMVSGKPVVASYSGFPSMINEAESGSFVPAGDAAALRDEILKYAALSSEKREEMGAAGREWILENRAYSKLASDYIDIMN